jgi:hypothetical protein
MIDSTGNPGITGVTSGVVAEEVVVTGDSLLVVWVWTEEVLCWLVALVALLVLLVLWVLDSLVVLVDVELLVAGPIVEVIDDV